MAEDVNEGCPPRDWPVCLSEEQTVRRVLAGMSLARFGDGEFKIAMGGGTSTHKPSERLAQEFRGILVAPPKGLLPAIPPMDPRDLHLWNWQRHKPRFVKVLDMGRVYGSAMVGRAKSCPWLLDPKYLALFRSIWKGRKVVAVCPPGHHLEKLLAPTVASMAIVRCPIVEAYDDIERLHREALATKADMAVICAGPAAKALAARLCGSGMQAVDLGRGSGLLLKHGPPLT